jgi:HEAT repeat protein
MEILSPSILQGAWNVALVLTGLSALVLAVIVAVRWQAQIAARRAADFREQAEPLVMAYLAGREKREVVAAALQRDPDAALLLLMEISERISPSGREPLRALFSTLPLLTKEISALQSRDWQRRLQAVSRLAFLGDGDSTSALLDALGDPVLSVRLAAARALGQLGEARAVTSIVLAFDLPGEMNQRRVAEALLTFGAAAVPSLLEVLEDPQGAYSDNAINLAARVLGLLRALEAVQPLAKLLDHAEFRVRLNAVRSLGLIGEHSSADDVARLADDSAWEVRNVVMQALGRLHSDRHLDLLVRALHDSSWWVRFSAAQALWQLGDVGRAALTSAMTGDTDRYARDMSRQILEEHGAITAREVHTL